MLTVITGRSRRLWPRVLAEIGQAQAAGAKRLFLITPDQFTLQAELELVDRLDLPGLLTIEVLSPSRLLTRVFSLAGSPQRVRVDARGKAMMLADVLRQSAWELAFFGGSAGRRGFADRLAVDIGNFKRAGKGPEDVALLAEQQAPEDALRAKFEDLALLYARYEQRLEGAFLDGEDAQEALLVRLPESGLLEGAQIWIYGFDLISPQFMRQIAVMARGAESVRLALTMSGAEAGDASVFTPSRDVVQMLGRYLHEERLLWEQEQVETPLEAAPEIQHLEAQLYALKPVIYEGPVEAISLSVAANPYEEAMRAAARMLALAREGMRFEEMAVVLGDAEGYAGAIESAFGRSGIPYHLTRSRPALAHPLLRSWMAGLRCATMRYRAEDALDWLKGGFCGLTVEEAERLENYALENGLKGAKWKRPIDDPALEDLRSRFMAPLEMLRERLAKARTNTQTLSAVYGLLEDVDAYGTLEGWQETLAGRGLLTEAAECAQAWRLALETLDQLHALLHGSRMRMADIAQVVESGLAAAELGTVPATPGVVQVGQLGHMKIAGVCRALFLLGMEDGVMRSGATSLISDAEVERAAEAAGQTMAFGLRGDALAQLMQINLLDTLSAPSERLYISHASVGPGGDARRPAAALKLLRRIFPQLEETGSVVRREAVWHAPGAALDALGPMLRGAVTYDGTLTQAERETAAWLLHDPSTRRQAEAVMRALETKVPPDRLGSRAADALYAHTRTSISRLESFASCPFEHFVSYGLRPIPRKPYEVERSDMGTFYHRAMEGYTRAAAENPAWPQVGREESDAMMERVLEPIRQEWANTPLGEDAMMRAAGEAFCRVARRVAWTYAGQMQRGGFRTGQIEARFGPGELLPAIALILPDGSRCWVEGRIDRIDFLEEEGERWLRVVDYKSGSTSLEPAKLYGGLQLQLLLYLAAALAAFPGVAPAGAFYARLQDPLIQTDSRDVAEIERKLADALRLDGIVLADVRIVRAMEDAKGSINKDGTVSKATNAASEGELAALMRHAYTLAASMAGQIAAGEIVARPAKLGNWQACQWCEYRGVCGFDASLDGYAVRELEKLSKEELLERIVDEDA